MNEKPQNLRSAVFLFLPINTSYVPVVTIGTALYRELILPERVWATVDTMLQRCLKGRGRKY